MKKSMLIVLLPLAAMFFFVLCIRFLIKDNQPVKYDFTEFGKNEKKGQELIEGSFTLRIDKPMNETIPVMYAIPIDGDTGKLRRNASKIVFYAPYCGDERRLKDGFIPWHRDFAEIYGYSIFTFAVNTSKEMIEDDSIYYIYKENGWPEIVFQIQEQIQKRFALKEEKLYIVGESSGGSFAQQIVAAYPDKVCKAAWNGGTRYAPFQKDTKTRILATNIWGDTGCIFTGLLHDQATSMGIDMEFYVTPPNDKAPSKAFKHHAGWQLNYDIITCFITGNDYKNKLKNLPDIDFGIFDSYIYPSPESPSALTVVLSDFSKDDFTKQIALQDMLWAIYNQKMVPAFINRHGISLQDIDVHLNRIKDYAKNNKLTVNIKDISEKELKL